MPGLDQLIVGLGGGGLARNTYQDMQEGSQRARQNENIIQQSGMNIAAAQQKQAHDAAWQQDVQAYFAKPDPLALGNLIQKYPDKAEEFKQSKAIMDEPQRQSQLTQYSSLYNAADNNRPDLVRRQIGDIQAAEKLKGIADPQVDDIIGQLDSKDPAVVAAAIKQAKGFTMIHLAALDSKFAETLSKPGPDQDHFTSTGDGAIYDKRSGDVVRQAPQKPEWQFDAESGSWLQKPGTGGGGPVSSGPAAGTRGDVSRLINTDAGGGYVPSSVNTLGQFVGFGKSLNQRGAKSSSAGTYQINGTTMAEFAPKVFGPEWKSAPFNAQTQDRVGASIFNWAKQQRDPAAALRGRWVSLDPKTAERLIQGDWQQARGTIAQKETGGAPGASAASGSSASGVPLTQPGVVNVRAPKGKPARMSPQEVQAEGLDPNVVYYRDGNGIPQSISGQTRATKQAPQLKEGQAKATGLLAAAVAATDSMANVQGYSPSVVSLALNDLSNKNPIKQELSQKDRRVLNAQLAFGNAILRLETGASIAKDEAAMKAQVLFPQPGDGPEVQADKRRQREAALKALRAASGPGGQTVPLTASSRQKPATSGFKILGVRKKQ